MRAADDADFTEFVAAASRRLLRGAYLITGDMAAAEDLLQTALERTYRRWTLIRRRESPEAYVRRILVNSATDAWRRQRKILSAELDELAVPAEADPPSRAFQLALSCWPACGSCPSVSELCWCSDTSTT